MYNLDRAIDGLFYAFAISVFSVIIFAVYVLLQPFFWSMPWEICNRLETDSAKVQCMEAHYDERV